MENAIINLVVAIVGVAIAVITTYTIPWLKSKVEADEWERLIYYATLAVRFANQTMTPEQWKEKKKVVTEYLQNVVETKLHIEVTDEDIDKIIEGIVNEVKEGKENVG